MAIISHLNGVDVYQIMKSLGHEQLSASEKYLEKVFEKERHRFIVVWGVYIEEDLHIQRGFCDFWSTLKRSVSKMV
ncbi:hypothetical protein ACQKMY_21270 [Peribacillus frigoritolerans]|uniref:hypothetical protein n=1 Tax=Peribacillus frigoritolerans TaxID=450367 RepID=UPI003D0815F6